MLNTSAAVAVTCGAAMLVPAIGVYHLLGFEGARLCAERVETIMSPGADKSGFLSPYLVGPRLLNEETSPSWADNPGVTRVTYAPTVIMRRAVPGTEIVRVLSAHRSEKRV